LSSRIIGLANFALWIAAFAVSIYAVSGLLPLLLQSTVNGFTYAAALSTVGHLITISLCVLLLARGIYRVDRRAGRVRNKVKWFE